MKLRSLESATFGKLKITEPLLFGDEFNLLCAQNQAGKSTLLTLLEWILYGVPPHGGRRSQAEVERWTPWGGGRPTAVLTLAPERPDWPRMVRIDAHFDEFRPYLSDLMTLADISSRVNVDRNGSWDLGFQLTGLRRETFRASLLAPQGELDNVLSDVELRKLLTADLAGLVEDEDRASLDAAAGALDKPGFTMNGLAPSPLLLPNLVRRAEEEAKRCAQAYAELQGKQAALGGVLAEREEAEYNLIETRRKIEESDALLARHELAAAHWRFSEAERCRMQLREWERRLGEAPWLAQFPADLEGAVKRWQGEQSAQKRSLADQRDKLARARDDLNALEARLKKDEPLLPQLEKQRELGELKAALELGRKELDAALAKTKEYGEVTDTATRTRFEALDSRVKAFRESVPDLFSWSEQAEKVKQTRQTLTARMSEINKQLATSPMLFYAGVGVAGVTGIVLLLLGLQDRLGLLLGGAALLVLAVALAVLGVRSASRQAVVRKELKEEVEPGLSWATRSDEELARSRAELLVRLSLSPEQWEDLAADLPEYQRLRTRLENYALAMRDREAAEARISTAWSRTHELCPDAPADPQAAWIGARIELLQRIRQNQARRMDLVALVKDEERSLANIARTSEETQQRIGRLLAPLGLEQRALADPDAALLQFESYQREARSYQAQQELLATAEDKARQISLSREEYERRLQQLGPEEARTVTAMVQSEDGYLQLNRENRQLRDGLARQRQELDQKQSRLGRLREQVAKDEEALLAIPAAEDELTASLERLATAQRWQRAIELLQGSLSDLRAKLASNLAPKVTEELKLVLRQAPLPGLEDAALGDQLELRLRYKDSPPGLTATELLDRLSLGAKRQLALCLRSAVARALGADHSAPLLLDEPLAELDDSNAQAWLSYVAQLANGSQVLLTTCHRAQYDWLVAQTHIRATAIALP